MIQRDLRIKPVHDDLRPIKSGLGQLPSGNNRHYDKATHAASVRTNRSNNTNIELHKINR